MKKTNIADLLISNDEATGWLVTYSDLVTLLLVFFVLLYSLSSLKQEKFMSAISSIKQQLNTNTPLTGISDLIEIEDSTRSKISIEDITGLKVRQNAIVKNIDDFINKIHQSKNISVQTLNNKIIITITGKILFNSGSASLNEEALPVLDEITSIIFKYPEYIVNIKGHTDNVPIATTQFPSNWELSAIRATTVLKYLIKNGVKPNRLTATGYGDVMPLVPNTSAENRAINRRVEFVLEKTENQ